MLLAFASAGFAQIGTSSVVGRIRTRKELPSRNVDVQLLRGATNEPFRTVTTASGDYSLVSLPVDTYSLRVSTRALKRLRESFTLEVGHAYRADFSLTRRCERSGVLSGEASLLKTETPEFGEVIDNKKIESRPLNDRDVLGTLGALTPGVTPERGSKTSGTGSGLSFNVRGMRKMDNLCSLTGQ